MKNLLILLLLFPFCLQGQIDTAKLSQGIDLMEQGIELMRSGINTEKAPDIAIFTTGTNFSPEIDQLMAQGHALPNWIRLFELQEKFSLNKRLPRDETYQLLPEENRGVGVEWNGTMLDSWNRHRTIKIKNPNSRIVSAWEVIYPNGTSKGFPGKHFIFEDMAYVDGSDGWQQWEKDAVYSKAYEMYYAWYVANGELVDYVSPNEWWGMDIEQFLVFEASMFDARRDYNHTKGRFDDYTPKIGSNTLPIGQGAKYVISVEDLAQTKLTECAFIDVHTYMIDDCGEWQDDFSIVESQLNIALAFQQKHAPGVPIWVTETGAPHWMAKSYFEKLYAYFDLHPEFKAMFSYAYLADPTVRFGDLYMIDSLWNSTEAWEYLKTK